MKSFKRYINERAMGVGPGGGDALKIGVDSDTGMSAGDVTNADTLRKLNSFIGMLLIIIGFLILSI